MSESAEQGDPGEDIVLDEATPKTESKSQSQPKSGGKSAGAKDSGPAPWAKDLADRGLDDPRIDEYLRESWQPRMTQYEQQISQYDELFGGDMDRAQMLAGLAEALENDPQGTYAELGQLLGLSDGEFSGDDEDFAFDEQPDEGESPDQYREWVMNKMQEEQVQQQDQAYESLLSELEGQYPGFDRGLFHAAIVAHDGDPEQALGWYMQYHREPSPPDTPDGPTPVGEGNPTPPEAQEYSGIGEALQAFMQEEKARKG
jgi:hypothetical protein